MDGNKRLGIKLRKNNRPLSFLATFISKISSDTLYGESTICNIIHEVANSIIILMKDRYLRLPKTEEEWMERAKEFEVLHKLPHCVASIGMFFSRLNSIFFRWKTCSIKKT